MFRRILIPVDGSELAWGALAWAELLASKTDAEIFMLQVVPPIGGVFTARPTPSLLAAAVREQEREVEAATTALSNSVHALHGRGLNAGRYVQVGMPAAKILEFAKQHVIDLILMGTHGRGGVPRALLGSVADEVRREAAVPVVLVPRNAILPLGDLLVLICLDASVEAESALDDGLDLAQGLHARVALLNIADNASSANSAAAYLTSAAEKALAQGVQAATIVGRGEPGPDILLKARTLHADVLALSSRSRSGLTRTVLGSVATYVLSRSNVPVLLTHRTSRVVDEVELPIAAYTSHESAVNEVRRDPSGS